MVEKTLKEKRQSSSQHLLNLEDAKQIICYPEHQVPNEECYRRIEQLRKKGIKYLISTGKVKIDKINILGKGHAGIVSAALLKNGKIVAIKIRRYDSKRESLEKEATLQYIAALAGIAPSIYAYSKDFIIMDLIEGISFGEYLEIKYRERNEDDILLAIKSLIEKTFVLDCIGIEHQELSNPQRQVMIQNYDPRKIFILDYESAKYTVRTSNITSIIGFIIGRGRKYLHLSNGDLKILIELSKTYKRILDIDRRYTILNRLIDILNKCHRRS